MQTRSAHRLLSQCLAGAVGQALEAKDLPANNVEWQRVLRLSSDHVVTPLVRRALQENSLISGLPTDVLVYLDAFYALNLDNNRRYEDQLAHLIQTLNSIGVRPVLLKGAAALVSGLYPTPGERYIGDIDILIPPLKLGEILNKLRAEGYMPGATDDEHPTAEDFVGQGSQHHYPPIKSLDWPVWVELHVHPVDIRIKRLFASEEIVRDATLLNWRGGECLLPSPTHFVTHNVIHAFLVDYEKKGFLPLRQLFEFVHASRIYGDQIDWVAIQQRFEGYRDGTALLYYVALANAYLGFQAPPELLIGRWIQLRTELHCAWVYAPFAIYFRYLFSLIKKLQRHVRNLGNPRSLKKLLTLGFYVRFYQELRSLKTETF